MRCQKFWFYPKVLKRGHYDDAQAGVETLHKELEPKMRGVKVLEEVLEDHADCEFVVLFSSMAAILGG